MIGTTIASRFKIISELGQGGFSKTFIAQDCHLPGHPKCVIKQLEPPTTDSLVLEITQRMFDREAQVLYKLGRHDQIPQLLAHFDHEKKFYLAIELIDGKVLSQEIYDGCRHDEAYVLQLLKDTLQTLAFVHDQNVIHRDIKPSNLIRRSSDQKLVLIDFGAVKEVAIQPAVDREPTKQTVAIGSHGYMPNEQANGRPKFASDLYSLGMVCIQALTGVPPKNFPEDAKTGEIIWHNLAPQAGEELKAFLDKLIRSHFTQRFETAREAIASFNRTFTDISAIKVTENFTDSVKTSINGIPQANLTQTYEPTVYNGGNAQTIKIESPSTLQEAQPISPAQTQKLASEILNATHTKFVDEEAQPISPAQTEKLESEILNPTHTKFVDDDSELCLIIDRNIEPTTLEPPSPTNLSSSLTRPTTHPLVFLSLIVLFGSAIAAYFVWQNYETDKRYAQTVNVINSMFSEKKYQECIKSEDAIPVSSPHFVSAKIIIDNCQKELKNQTAQQNLVEANRLISGKRYDQALAKLTQISTDTPSYQLALQQTETAGKELLKTATNAYQNQGKLDLAVAQLQTIPETVPSGKSAKQLVSKWRKEWADNAKIKSDMEQAVKAKNWQRVISLNSRLTTAYWKNLKDVQKAVRDAEVALLPPVINEPRIAPTAPQRYTPPQQYSPPPAPPVYRPPARSDDGVDNSGGIGF